MRYNINKRVLLNLLIIIITIVTSSLCYYNRRGNAYEVRTNGKVIGYVKNKKTVDDIEDNIKKRFNIRLKRTYFSKVILDDNKYTDSNALEKSIITENEGIVDALEVDSDGKQLMVCSSENEAKTIIDQVKNYYAKIDNVSISSVKLKNTIKYVQKKVLLSRIDTVETIAKNIINDNKTSKVPLLTFELNGTIESKEVIDSPTTVTWSSDLILGQSKVVSSGKEGSKLVTKQVTMNNDKVVTYTVLSEKVLTEPKNRVIEEGNKNPVVAKEAFLKIPSRGAISSPFGMRWGRMHEGVDIAANYGSPICAAMDGTVSFAGWEDGYGNTVKIDHGDGIQTLYGHSSQLEVKQGQKVKAGDEIAKVGSTGDSTGPHVHFEVRSNGVAVNPLDYLK